MLIIDSLLKFKFFFWKDQEQFSLWRGRGEPLSFFVRVGPCKPDFSPRSVLIAKISRWDPPGVTVAKRLDL
jgi:hypothetical protein